MALNDNAVIIPGTGHVYFAPAGTPQPTDLTDPGYPWTDIGHTSSDNNFKITKDGGDSNILGTWQNPALRERRDPVVYALTFNLLQVTNETLALYFGGGDATVSGKFGVSLTPRPQERALFVRIVDGDVEVPLYVPKVSVASDDDVEADIEKFLEFPVRATILGVTGQNLMDWLGSDLGLHTSESQTVGITGTPTGGTFSLSFAGSTTAGIAYNAAAAAVKSALEALDSVGAGNVAVTGGPGPATPWIVAFQGDLAGIDVPALTGSAVGLTGGTTPAIVITQGAQGGA